MADEVSEEQVADFMKRIGEDAPVDDEKRMAAFWEEAEKANKDGEIEGFIKRMMRDEPTVLLMAIVEIISEVEA